MATRKTKHRRYAPPVKYTAEELLDYEIIDLRVDYASTGSNMNAKRARDGIEISKVHEWLRYQRELAHKIPTKLGHTALRQGDAFECAKCGASGTATRLLNGDVFWQPCGLPIDGAFAPFGKEETADQCRRRARYEHGCAQELVAADGLGDSEIAAGHTKAALAYEARAEELSK